MDNGMIYWRYSKHNMPCKNNNSGRETPSTDKCSQPCSDETDSHVERNFRKRAREEVVPIPSIYTDALIELARNMTIQW